MTIVLFAVCFITRKLELLAITYIIMLIHEFAHLAAAVCIGLKPAYIAFQPFGVNLKLKNKIVYSLADEIILYAAGPMCNIFMALAALIIHIRLQNVWLWDFYIKNIALFVVNMLPIIPLDGGIILKKMIMHKYGYKKAQNIMIGISVIFILLLSVFGIYAAVQSQFNFSVLFLVIFMIGNVFTQKEKYNIDFIKELMFYKEKGTAYHKQNVKIMTAHSNCNFRMLAKKFNIHDFFIVYILNDAGEIDDIMTETQILNRLTN